MKKDKQKEWYITEIGYEEIVKLFSTLKKEKIFWTEEKRIAALQGDRSENAEYIAAKENIRNIDKRLCGLNKVINNATMVKVRKDKKDKVLFGSEVLLEDNTGELLKIQIVGTHELIYLQKVVDIQCVSNISPLGQELMLKSLGTKIVVKENTYIIRGINE